MKIQAAHCVVMVLGMLVSCAPPSHGWYKQVSGGPSYYSVGRASGLLSGIHRPPPAYMRRRSQPEEELPSDSAESTASNTVLSAGSARQHFILKSMPICIKEISPNLRHCELYEDLQGTFRCRAEVLLSLDSLDCGTGGDSRRPDDDIRH
ncbi:hypothetical protein NHX12_032518 [Muraenolepis orangiensis]|uniref:Neuropeptide B n=1 Tax=Muraenolepis orangiensis TaxID=630683 RepID=A0A9Q0E9X0_9TELE|nr:hypothetical protein NHX12_032518 [Muraenolepis orangiensis]